MEFEINRLSNGIKVVHSRTTTSEIAHLGLFINAGSRDEKIGQNGLAHFTEHCLFKGTRKRKLHHILNRMDSVGAELDAYTSKEETCIHSTFMADYYPRSVELISDIISNSTFPDKEIEKERSVILDEIQSYLDNPYEQIYDDFEQLIYNEHPIGRAILGEKKSIQGFSNQDLNEFVQQYYCAENLTISSVGNISTKRLLRLLEKHFGSIQNKGKQLKRESYHGYLPKTAVVKKNTNQAHLALGCLAYDYKHHLSDSMALLNNILGGPAMNSRLNLNIRERYGFTYQIESQYIPYSDSGVFFIYAGMDQEKMDKTKKLILKELNAFVTRPLTTLQLNKAKKQFIGQIAIGRDNPCSRMLANGKSLSSRGEIDSIEVIHNRIQSISAKQIQEVATEIFDHSKFSELRYI